MDKTNKPTRRHRRALAVVASVGALAATGAAAAPAGATTNTPNGPLPTCQAGSKAFQAWCVENMKGSLDAWYFGKPPRY